MYIYWTFLAELPASVPCCYALYVFIVLLPFAGFHIEQVQFEGLDAVVQLLRILVDHGCVDAAPTGTKPSIRSGNFLFEALGFSYLMIVPIFSSIHFSLPFMIVNKSCRKL